MSAPRQPLPGRILGGRFQVGEQLHLGGTVEVYAATDLRGGGDVAIKVLSHFASRDSALRRRLATEAHAAGILQHPHVVQVIDYGEEPDGLAYIVMERLRGQTLRQRLDAEGTLPIDDARRFALEILASLGAAHSLGIRHRDLKPSNVFLSRDDDGTEHAKIMDFGVAKLDGLRHTSSDTVGTPRYFPPERIQAPAAEDVRGDLHAVGVILYESLVGSHPFEAGSLEEQIQRMLESEAPSARAARAQVPEALARVIARALARDPSERWASAAEMAEALGRAM